jgi:phage portal protein BeeE
MILDRARSGCDQMTGVDAQHIETRRTRSRRSAASMGVLPIMVGYSDKAATYASAEQMFLAHLVHTLSPRWTMYEQSIDVNLLTTRSARRALLRLRRGGHDPRLGEGHDRRDHSAT